MPQHQGIVAHAAEEFELGIVVDRDIASVDGFGYSGALTSIDGDWTPEELSAFLESPKGYAPGTTMGFAGLRKVEDRADVIAYLQSVTN